MTTTESEEAEARGILARAEQAQRDGAEKVGTDLERRLSLPGLLYFTEVGRPISGASAGGVVLLVLAVVAAASSLLVCQESEDYVLVPLIVAGILGWQALKLLAREGAKDRERWAGIEVEGLYLTGSMLVLRHPGGFVVVPRERAVRIEKRRRGSSERIRHDEVLHFQDASGEAQELLLGSSSRKTIAESCRRWLTGELFGESDSPTPESRPSE